MKVYVAANPKEVTCVPEPKYHLCPIIQPLYPELTNNEAEYMAVIIALNAFPSANEIMSDSLLVVKQLEAEWIIKEDRLRVLARDVWKLAKSNVKFTWIPKQKNLADKVLGQEGLS